MQSALHFVERDFDWDLANPVLESAMPHAHYAHMELHHAAHTQAATIAMWAQLNVLECSPSHDCWL